MAREINRARILLALDEKVPGSLIIQVLGVERAEKMLARVEFHSRQLAEYCGN